MMELEEWGAGWAMQAGSRHPALSWHHLSSPGAMTCLDIVILTLEKQTGMSSTGNMQVLHIKQIKRWQKPSSLLSAPYCPKTAVPLQLKEVIPILTDSNTLTKYKAYTYSTS